MATPLYELEYYKLLKEIATTDFIVNFEQDVKNISELRNLVNNNPAFFNAYGGDDCIKKAILKLKEIINNEKETQKEKES